MARISVPLLLLPSILLLPLNTTNYPVLVWVMDTYMDTRFIRGDKGTDRYAAPLGYSVVKEH